MDHTRITRRGFLKSSASFAAIAASIRILPREVLGALPGSDRPRKLNLGIIGCGGMGRISFESLAGHNFLAVCDVDRNRFAPAAAKHAPKAARYADFRELLDREKSNIEAVAIATPDHTHAVITMAAMKAGKHVYCQKPLTHTVVEARTIASAARQHKVMTQMGNQGHAGEGIRLTTEWIQAGVIGEVREVHAWTNHAKGPCKTRRTDPIPPNLDWDLWLGPTHDRPYMKDVYHPGQWRFWWELGSGSLGDMAVHNADPAFMALKLGYPTSIEAQVSEADAERAPTWSNVTFEFPARGSLPPVKLIWHDGIDNGRNIPPRPADMEKEINLPKDNGILFLGEKGSIYAPGWAGIPRLCPESKMKAFTREKRPPQTIVRTKDIFQDWAEACLSGKPACSRFEEAAPMVEVILLGVIASRNPGKKLQYDAAAGKFKNDDKANSMLHIEYRKGWTL